jgi:hypothetical protein
MRNLFMALPPSRRGNPPGDPALKVIGVLLGHRRIMLGAIARLNDTPVAAASAEVAVLRRSPLRSQLPRRLPNLLANVGTRRFAGAR